MKENVFEKPQNIILLTEWKRANQTVLLKKEEKNTHAAASKRMQNIIFDERGKKMEEFFSVDYFLALNCGHVDVNINI